MQKRLKNRTIFVTKICMSENQDELKVQIKAWLKQQNISRNDFAEECFVSPNTVRNWLAKVAIPKDKEALIRLMMEKTEREKKLKEAARAHWKPFAVMLSAEDYKLIEEAARRDNMTVEEWAEATLIKDAQKRMKNYYDDESSRSFPPSGSLFPPVRRRLRRPFPPLPSGWCIRTAWSWTGKENRFRKDTRLMCMNSATATERCSGNVCS